MGKKHKKPTVESLEKSMAKHGESTTTMETILETTNSVASIVELTPKSQELSRDKQQTLSLAGKFYGGILTCDKVKSSVEFDRLQRIIIEDNGRKYEYTRTHIF